MRGLSSDSGTAPEATAPTGAPLSAILITRNEASNIVECLASVAFARERIVVDNGSTDDTVALATAAGARVVVTADWPGFGAQKNRALALATEPWVLSLDADERVTPELRDEILRTLQSPAAEAWDMPRRSSYCGQFIAHSGWYPDRVTRLFKRGTARFSDDLVHERLVTDAPPAHLNHDLVHRSFPDFESVLDKLDRYSTAGALRLHAQGRKGSVGRAVLHGLWAFVRTYVLRRGFLDGRMGFLLAVSNAEGTYYRYVKLWLMQRRG
ncbi:glycosyltransferase family 2 protein [Ramlibacter sp.]|uniref:glycosyltransferase family 2 protein n=1 Tax=Ramlibacter sp. TaxID=1917967 RepID=UPI003D100FF1